MPSASVRDVFGDAWPGMVRFSAVFLAAAVVYYIIFVLSGITSETVLYFGYAEAMVSGQMPYSGFDAEYPPMGMALILIPRLFSFNELSYQIAFGVMMFLFLLAGAYFVHGICSEFSPRPARCVDLYLLFCLILIDFVLDRYDAAPMVMALGGLYFLLKGRDGVGWVLIALGTMAKLYPAILAPILMIWMIRRGRTGDAAKGLGICMAVCMVCMLPFLIAEPSTAFSFMGYHAERGLQVESVTAGFIMVLSELGLTDITFMFEYGSDNIYGSLPEAAADLMIPLLAVALIIIYAVFYAILGKKEGECHGTVITACFAVTLAFMVLNKVLSSQYLVWIIPYAVMLWAMLPASAGKRASWMFILAVGLTQLNMVVNYALRTGSDFSAVGIMVIFLRNIVLLWFAWKLIERGIGSLRGDPPEPRRT